MTKYSLIIFFTLLLSFQLFSQTIGLDWASGMGGSGYDKGLSIDIDGYGNIYTTGEFRGTVDFDPDTSEYYLSSQYSQQDIFITKQNNDGSLIWAKSFGQNFSYCHSHCVDSIGNVYTIGRFLNTVDFDPGPGIYNLSAYSGYDIFISKIDSAGNFIWAINYGNFEHNYVYSVDIDTYGNVYLTGYFHGTIDFDPGPGIFELTSYLKDIFILKLNSSGEFIFVKMLTGSHYDYGYDIIVDQSGNIYTTGAYNNYIDCDPGPGVYNLTSNGDEDIFILKLDINGDFVWAKSIGGVDSERAMSIGLDNLGNIFIAGNYEGTVDFNPGAGVYNLTSVAYEDIFLVKLSPIGQLAWAQSFGGTSYDQGNDLSVDHLGNVYLTGLVAGNIDFDNGPGVYNIITESGSSDIFISKFDTNGQIIWGSRFGDQFTDNSYSLCTDNSDGIYFTGYFQGEVDFNPNMGNNTLTAVGQGDIFIVKLSPCLPTSSNLSVVSCDNYHSPSGDSIWYQSGIYLDIFSNSSGCDSIITIDLTITDNTESIINESFCDSYISPSGNYIWLDSGTYLDTIPNSIGCDSFIIINLINESNGIVIYENSCFSYNFYGIDLTETGTYYDTLSNLNGCDSIIELNLTITDFDTSISQDGIILTANESNAIYQWLDCSNNNAIPGETSQSFTPTLNGDYAVIVTKYTCTNISDCFTISSISIDENYLNPDVKIYPNPAKDFVHIDLNEIYRKINIQILGINGQILNTYNFTNKLEFDIDIQRLTVGEYIIRINSDEKLVFLTKLIVE